MKDFKKIKEIAKANESGFTISLTDFNPIEKGYCVAFKETQNCFNDEGLKKAINFAKKTTNIVGGWKSQDGKFYYDAIMIVEDEKEAVKIGKANGQLAIFNLETKEVIDL